MSDIIKNIIVGIKPKYEYTQEELIVVEQFTQEFESCDIIVTIGDFVIKDNGEIIKIVGFVNEPYERWYENGRKMDRPVMEVKRYIIYQEYENGRLCEQQRLELCDFIHYRYGTKIVGSVEDLHSESMSIILGHTILSEPEEKISDSTAVMTGVSKELLLSHRRELLIQRDMAEAKRRYIKGILEQKTRELYSMVDNFKRQIKKVMRVVQTLELFLGIKEELFQIQEGSRADINEPLTFRQQILFMDEEVGDPTHGGLDISSIGDFDKWLLNYSDFYKKYNYELIMPEKKGVIALRVRRNKKHYSSNPFLNNLLNASNSAVYLLIRNGENIYRIWSENLSISERLFPGRKEFANLAEEYTKSYSDYDKEKIDDQILDYKAHFVMLQGLIDRTDVFTPIPEQINLLTPEPLEKGLVNFIYDDEVCLPTNRLPFITWQKNINTSIEEGCRIFTSGYKWDYSDKMYDINRRFKKYYRHVESAPYPPGPGVYTILEDPEWVIYGNHKRVLKFIYTPKAKYWHEGEVKKGSSFKIDEDDDNIINYDKATLDDIEFYLHNRIDRRYYLSMMPILVKMKEYKLAEMEKEMHFVKLVVGQLMKDDATLDTEQTEKIVLELVAWWKLKNKWKRAIESDNAKALRMIIKEFKRKQKE